MKSSERVVRKVLVGALVLAMGVTTLFTNAGSSYAAGEVKLNKTSRNILTRQSFDFDVTGAPKDAVITWKSSDEAVATVDENGVVTGIKKGTATITCEITEAGKTQTLTAEVKICKPAVKIEINNKVSELEYGKTVDLNRTLTPKTSNDVTTWKSSDTKIATVDKNGVVTALKDGTVTITATTMSGRSDSVEITVYGAPKPTATPEPTKAPDATATPVPTKAPEPTEAPKPTKAPKPTTTPKSDVVYKESFEKDAGKWVGRGNTNTVKSSVSSPDGMKYLEVSGRTASWNGPGLGLNSIVEIGGVYNVKAYVKQDSKDGEIIRMTWVKNKGSQYIAVSNAETKKGEWTLLEGTLTVDEDTTDIQLYFEADNATMNFAIDNVEIAKVSGGSKLVSDAAGGSTKLPDGSVVYSFKDLTPYKSYGVKMDSSADGGVSLAYEGQYQEVFYEMPKNFDMDDYEKVIIKLATKSNADSDAIVINISAADAAMNEWGNPTPMKQDWGVVSATPVEREYAASEFAGKEIGYISFMSHNGAANAVIYSVTFVPKK
ncbi:MAG: Ig-like domain-containing protein [Lachnospiraceae bacterium]|nr:Ig-like domain-containing protein [Lachnospiraceae bacterium]